MPWCPVCRNEYREGIKVCADCHTELVETLEPEERSEDAARQEELARMYAALLREQGAAAETDADWTDADADLDADTDADSGAADRRRPAALTPAYQDSAAKADDNRTSAYTLFFVGILGLAADVLVFCNVIPLFQNAGTTRYFICGVMGVLFILFLIFGFVSMRDSKVLQAQAKSEDSLVSELKKWCGENLRAEQIDEALQESGMSDEQKYFVRTDRMKELINDKFMNLDQGLLEHFVDEYYQELFEER